MEEENSDDCLGFNSGTAPPFLVSLTPIPTPSSRRLSTHFTPSQPLKSARRLAWISLEGRIVNAEEASCAKAIGGGMKKDEVLAWQLFSPVQRFLIVAVIGVAVAESKKNRLISQLTRSVELRDQLLLSMQQKLDSLCEQLSIAQNNARTGVDGSCDKNVELLSRHSFGNDYMRFVQCGCWHCHEHQDSYSSKEKGDEVLQYKTPSVYEVEPEERRMSDLSDWISSTTSVAEIQMNTFPLDQDISNLKRECEEKDTLIKELTAILQSTKKAGSKRVGELEDIIRRKNATITRLKKDVMVLDQKLVQLTRKQRSSSSVSISNKQQQQHPFMMDNIVYDMNSSTSSSSSDSDSQSKQQTSSQVTYETPKPDKVNSPFSSDSDLSPIKQRRPPIENQKTLMERRNLASTPSPLLCHPKPSSSLARLTKSSRTATPLREISTCQSQKSNNTPLPRRQRPSSTDPNGLKIKARSGTTSASATPKRRWN